MATYIYFRGLICHHDGNPYRNTGRAYKSASILIPDPQHQPYIHIKGGISNVVTRSIEFDPPGRPRVSPIFQNHVPHLEDDTNDNITLNIQAGLPVTLPAGDPAGPGFIVADYFRDGAIFTLTTPSELTCVARTTLLVADSTKLRVRYDGGAWISLSDDDCVFIENASKDDPPRQGDHWKEQIAILRGGIGTDLAGYRKGKAASNCDQPTAGKCLAWTYEITRDRKSFAATISECTNSQWP